MDSQQRTQVQQRKLHQQQLQAMNNNPLRTSNKITMQSSATSGQGNSTTFGQRYQRPLSRGRSPNPRVDSFERQHRQEQPSSAIKSQYPPLQPSGRLPQALPETKIRNSGLPGQQAKNLRTTQQKIERDNSLDLVEQIEKSLFVNSQHQSSANNSVVHGFNSGGKTGDGNSFTSFNNKTIFLPKNGHKPRKSMIYKAAGSNRGGTQLQNTQSTSSALSAKTAQEVQFKKLIKQGLYNNNNALQQPSISSTNAAGNSSRTVNSSHSANTPYTVLQGSVKPADSNANQYGSSSGANSLSHSKQTTRNERQVFKDLRPKTSVDTHESKSQMMFDKSALSPDPRADFILTKGQIQRAKNNVNQTHISISKERSTSSRTPYRLKFSQIQQAPHIDNQPGVAENSKSAIKSQRVLPTKHHTKSFSNSQSGSYMFQDSKNLQVLHQNFIDPASEQNTMSTGSSNLKTVRQSNSKQPLGQVYAEKGNLSLQQVPDALPKQPKFRQVGLGIGQQTRQKVRSYVNDQMKEIMALSGQSSLNFEQNASQNPASVLVSIPSQHTSQKQYLPLNQQSEEQTQSQKVFTQTSHQLSQGPTHHLKSAQLVGGKSAQKVANSAEKVIRDSKTSASIRQAEQSHQKILGPLDSINASFGNEHNEYMNNAEDYNKKIKEISKQKDAVTKLIKQRGNGTKLKKLHSSSIESKEKSLPRKQGQEIKPSLEDESSKICRSVDAQFNDGKGRAAVQEGGQILSSYQKSGLPKDHKKADQAIIGSVASPYDKGNGIANKVNDKNVKAAASQGQTVDHSGLLESKNHQLTDNHQEASSKNSLVVQISKLKQMAGKQNLNRNEETRGKAVSQSSQQQDKSLQDLSSSPFSKSRLQNQQDQVSQHNSKFVKQSYQAQSLSKPITTQQAELMKKKNLKKMGGATTAQHQKQQHQQQVDEPLEVTKPVKKTFVSDSRVKQTGAMKPKEPDDMYIRDSVLTQNPMNNKTNNSPAKNKKSNGTKQDHQFWDYYQSKKITAHSVPAAHQQKSSGLNSKQQSEHSKKSQVRDSMYNELDFHEGMKSQTAIAIPDESKYNQSYPDEPITDFNFMPRTPQYEPFNQTLANLIQKVDQKLHKTELLQNQQLSTMSQSSQDGRSGSMLTHLVTFKAHSNSVIGLQSDPSAPNQLISLGKDNAVKIWSIKNQKQKQPIHLNRAAAINTNQKVVLCKQILNQGRPSQKLTSFALIQMTHGTATDHSRVSDSSSIFSHSSGQNNQTNMRSILATGSSDKILRLYAVDPQSFNYVSEQFQCVNKDGELEQTEVIQPQIKIVGQHKGPITSIVRMPGENDYMLTGCADHKVRLYCLSALSDESDDSLRIFDQGQTGVSQICALSENTFLSSGYDNSVRLWDIRQRNWLNIFEDGNFGKVTWMQKYNAETFATASKDGYVNFMEIRMNKPIKSVYVAEDSGICGIQFAKKREYMLVGHDNKVTVVNMKDERQGQQSFSLNVAEERQAKSPQETQNTWGASKLTSMVYSEADKKLYTGGFNSKICVWNLSLRS